MTSDNRTARSAREGTGNRRGLLFLLRIFRRQWPPPAPQIVSICARLSRLHPMPPEIRRKHRNATESRRRAVKLAGSTGTPTPKEKRQQGPLNGQRDGRGRRQPLTRARAFIPRPVVFSTIQDHQETARPATPAPMSSAPKADRQQLSRPHQPPARHRTTSHPSQEGSQRGARGEESPGAACSAGNNGQRRRLPLRHPTRDRRSACGKWRFARQLASLTARRCDNICYCNGIACG